MATESGFSNQKKIGEAQFKTIQNLGSDRHGSASAQKVIQVMSSVSITDVDASDDGRFLYLEIPSHGAEKYDVVRIGSGPLTYWEYDIMEVVDANILKVIKSSESAPSIGNTAHIGRWVTPTLDELGNVTVSDSPYIPEGYIAFDFSATNVDDTAWVEIEDSVPAVARKIQVFMSSGSPLILGFGAASSEVAKAILLPGGNGLMEMYIPAGTRLSVKCLKAETVSSGDLLINLLG